MTIKRQDTRKFDTPNAQGPGSHIVFSIPAWGETKEAVKRIREVGRDYLKEDVQVDETENLLIQTLWGLAQDKFLSWNWVDGAGQPLTDLNELDMNTLLNPEMEAIVDSVRQLYGLVDTDKQEKKDRRTSR